MEVLGLSLMIAGAALVVAAAACLVVDRLADRRERAARTRRLLLSRRT
jgi:hypothetical protein